MARMWFFFSKIAQFTRGVLVHRMSKVIKIFLSVISSVILVLITIPIAVGLLLSIPGVQRFAVDEGARFLSRKLDTRVEIGGLNVEFFNNLSIRGLYVEDAMKDTLLYAGDLTVGLKGVNIVNGAVNFSTVKLSDARFYLQDDSTGTLNLKRILGRLAGKDTVKKGTRLSFDRLDLEGLRFKMRRNTAEKRPYGVNFRDLDLQNTCISLRKVRLVNDSVGFTVNRIAFDEKSGFSVHELTTGPSSVSGAGFEFKDLHIDAAGSAVDMPYLEFGFSDKRWKSLGDFLHSVDIEAKTVDSRVGFPTIAYFAPSLAENTVWFEHLSMIVSGKVSDMYCDIGRVETRGSDLAATVRTKGLPDIRRTLFVAKIKNLNTSASDIDSVYRAFTGKRFSPALSGRLGSLGDIALTGNFNGKLSDFMADCDLKTGAGRALANLKVRQAGHGTSTVTGNVQANGLELGRLLDMANMGQAAFAVEVNGAFGKGGPSGQVKGNVSRLVYNGYPYSGINIDAAYRDRVLDGSVASADTNILLSVSGHMDMHDSIPSYRLEANVARLDLAALNFNRRDSVSVLRCGIRAEGAGVSLDDLNGTISIDSLVYRGRKNVITSDGMRITGTNNNSLKNIKLTSDFADVEYKGVRSYKEIFAYIGNTVSTYIPSLNHRMRESAIGSIVRPDTIAPTRYLRDYNTLTATIKQSALADVIVPGLEIADGTTLWCKFNPAANAFDLSLNSDYIDFRRGDGYSLTGLSVSAYNAGDSIAVFLNAKECISPFLYIPELALNAKVKDDNVRLSAGYTNPEEGVSAILNTMTRFYYDPRTGRTRTVFKINTSGVRVNRQRWRIESGDIVLDSSRVEVNRFRLTNVGDVERGQREQDLHINGVLDRASDNTLKVSMRNIDIAPFADLLFNIVGFDYTGTGFANGDVNVFSSDRHFLYEADINFDQVALNGKPVPDFNVHSNLAPRDNAVLFSLNTEEGGKRIVDGTYSPQTNEFKAHLGFKGFDLSFIDPMLTGILEGSRGKADLNIDLLFRNKIPSINGTIDIANFSTVVAYTKVRYDLNGQVAVKNNKFTLPATSVSDGTGGKGRLSAEFDLQNLSNITYSLHVVPDNLLAFNTTAKDNDLFYGRAVVSGAVDISGSPAGVRMDIDATTTGNSTFTLPLSDKASMSGTDYINVSWLADTTERKPASRRNLFKPQKKEKISASGGLDLNMTLNVQSNTQVGLVIDEQLATIMARGNGRLRIRVNPARDLFTMNGTYVIGTNGSYVKCLTKKLEIESGSSIQWTGGPLDATLDVRALYKLKTSLAPLLGDASSTRVPVNCVLTVADKLTQPAISVDISLPNSDMETQSKIASMLNTEDIKSQQFIMLLLTGSFYIDGSSESQAFGGSTATNAGLDIIFNQLNSLMANDKISFGINYRPGDNVSSDEWEVALSSAFADDRLLIEVEGNYDTDQAKASTPSGLSGNFSATYLIDREGSLRAKAFSRTVDRFDENQGTQENGLGLYYSDDFNNAKELWHNLKRKFTSKKKRERDQKSTRPEAVKPEEEEIDQEQTANP